MILFCTPLFPNQVSISIACPTLYNYQVGLNISKTIHVALIMVILVILLGFAVEILLLAGNYCMVAAVGPWLMSMSSACVTNG